MEISALKPVLRNIENSLRNQRKTAEKLRQKRKVKLKNKMYDEFLKLILFSIKKRTYRKKEIPKILCMVPRY